MGNHRPVVRAQHLPKVESVLLAATPILTFQGSQGLTNASGFFFQRDERLFLVTSRHVMVDEGSEHHPDRIEIALHCDPENVAHVTTLSIPLYRGATRGRPGGPRGRNSPTNTDARRPARLGRRF